MAHCGIQTPHYHGKDSSCSGNARHIGDAQFFCSAAHPDTVHNCDTGKDEPIARCRRLKGHDGPHQAFITAASTPDEWDNEPKPVEL